MGGKKQRITITVSTIALLAILGILIYMALQEASVLVISAICIVSICVLVCIYNLVRLFLQ